MPDPITVQLVPHITLLHHNIQASGLGNRPDILLLYHKSFHLVLKCPYLGHQIAGLVRCDA